MGQQRNLMDNSVDPRLKSASCAIKIPISNRKAVGDLAPGTYPLYLKLASAFHPLEFVNFDPRPFNDIFGVVPNLTPPDLIPVGFQINVNKSTQAPWIGYIDSVRFWSMDAGPGDFDFDGDSDGNDFMVWQHGATRPPLDPALLAVWQSNFGSATAAASAVPEPASGWLLLSTVIGKIATSRRAMRHRQVA